MPRSSTFRGNSGKRWQRRKMITQIGAQHIIYASTTVRRDLLTLISCMCVDAGVFLAYLNCGSVVGSSSQPLFS